MLGDKSRRHRLQPALTHESCNPDIFKAYDVRGVYPGEVNEEAARAIGAAFVAYLKAKRIAVSRDMRLSSPALAAAFIDGATRQGADVVDYGMIATDMLLFRRRARWPRRRRRRSPRRTIPKQYNGMKMVRQGRVAARAATKGIARHPRDDRRRRACRRRPRRRGTRDDEGRARRRTSSTSCRSSIASVIQPFNVVLDAGSGMGGLVAPKLFERLPCRTTRLCFEIDGTLSEPRSQPAHRREPPRHRRARGRGEGRHRHRLGRRRRSLLLHRRHRRVRVRRLRHRAARRSVPAEASGRDRSSTTCARATRSRTPSRATAARR